jgi:hypothetical protein
MGHVRLAIKSRTIITASGAARKECTHRRESCVQYNLQLPYTAKANEITRVMLPQAPVFSLSAQLLTVQWLEPSPNPLAVTN